MEIKLKSGEEIKLSALCNEVDAASHMERFPERWKAAAEFLASHPIEELADGEYELLPGREVYASVSSYVPKESDKCLFESHREYIDLQYVGVGREGMGVTRQSLPVTVPFAEGQDYAFYETPSTAEATPEAAYETTSPSCFYIFFPSDLHRPCIKNADSTPEVRKIVIKIRY